MSCSDGVVAGHEYPVGRREAKAGPARDRLLRHDDTQPLNALYISVVNLAEIRFGIELQEDPARRAELHAWLTLTLRPAFAERVLPVTEDILVKWRLLMEGGAEDRPHLFSPRPFAGGNRPSARAYGCHSRPKQFRQGRGAGS